MSLVSRGMMVPALGGLLWSLAGCWAETPAAGPPAKANPGSGAKPPEAAAPQLKIERRKVAQGPASGLAYDWITPSNMTDRTPVVVLGHGFMRSAARMRGLAEHLGRQGLAVACPDFRHSRPWRGGHEENARDLAELAKLLGNGRKVALAGFSAGGCSALLATKSFQPAALVLLDPVFAGAGAREVAVACHAPALVLFARPGSCNANGSGRPTAQALPKAKLIDLPGASHAHFEFPLDPLARAACGGAVNGANDAALQQQIRDEVAGFLRTQLLPAKR